MSLTREQILGAKPKTTEVDVPILGGTVTVRQMSARERIEFLDRANGEDRDSTGAWLVATLTVDEEGKPLFQSEDVKALQEKSFQIIDAIATAVLKLNGLHADSVEDAPKN